MPQRTEPQRTEPQRTERHPPGPGAPVHLSPGAKTLLVAIVVCAFALRAWYASHELNHKRFWDERYALANVSSYLDTGSLKPAKIYYPSPLTFVPAATLLRVSEGLHSTTGWEPLRTRSENDGFTPTGYALVRFTSVVYGTLAVFVLFGIGRKAFGPEVGLAAAAALAFLPAHIRASGYFKPDALLVLAVLLAFSWSWTAVQRPRVGTYLRAAFGITLALSAKVTGGIVALPLVIGSLPVRGGKYRRGWLLLLAAAAVFVLFIATNPYGQHYGAYTTHLQADYARRAAAEQMTRSQMPLRILESFVGSGKHGPWFGALFAVGGLGLLLGAARSKWSRDERILALMLLTFPLAFSAAYAAVTPYFKSNNFLSITPFTCLFGAWAAVLGWQRVRQRIASGAGGSEGARALVDTLAVGAFLAIAALPGPTFVYRSLIPTTFDRAETLIHGQRPDDLRHYHHEEYWERPTFGWERPRSTPKRGAAVVVERLVAEPTAKLDRADGAVFLRDRLRGQDQTFYRDLVESSSPGQIHHLQPSLFRTRGPALIAVTHRWLARGSSTDLPRSPCAQQRQHCWQVRLPVRPSRGIASLTIKRPKRAAHEPNDLEITSNGKRIDTWSPEGKPWLLMTERLYLRGQQIRISGAGIGALSEGELGIRLQEWRPGQTPAQTAEDLTG